MLFRSQLDRPGPWHLRLPHFKMEFTPSVGAEIQSEFFVALHDAPAALECLEKLAPEINPLLFITEVRAVKSDQNWMAPTYNQDVVAFHFTWKQEDAIHGLIRKIESELRQFNYRPHFGKVFYAKFEYLSKVYPKLSNFQELAKKHDPKKKFVNHFLQEKLGL